MGTQKYDMPALPLPSTVLPSAPATSSANAAPWPSAPAKRNETRSSYSEQVQRESL